MSWRAAAARLAVSCTMLTLASVAEIRVFRNIHILDEVDQGFGWIRPVYEGPSQYVDLTTCIRFFFKVIRRDNIIQIRKDGVNILWLYADNPSWLEFGFPLRKGSQISFLVDEMGTGYADIYDTNMWMHICVAFNAENGELAFVMNGKLVNIFGGFSRVEFPDDLVNHTIVGGNFHNNFMIPEGEFADFNVWNAAKSVQDMEDWTSCR